MSPTACTPSSYRCATRTARSCPAIRIEDCGRKIGLNGVDNGRIWFDQVRVPRDSLLDRYAQVGEDGRLHLRDRQPGPALLHDARHAGAGPGLRRRGRDQRQQGGDRHRGEVRPAAATVRAPGLGGRGAAARLRDAPAAVAAAARPHLRDALRPGAGRRRPARGLQPRLRGARSTPWPPTTSTPAGHSRRGPPGPRLSAPGTRRARSRSAARLAVAPATCRSTASTRCAPTPTSSPPSRATTRSCSSSSPRAC